MMYLDPLNSDDYVVAAVRRDFGIEVDRLQLWHRYKRKK